VNPSEWKEKLFRIKENFFDSINNATPENIEDIEVQFFGRKGHLSLHLRDLKDIPIEERKILGHIGNSFKEESLNLLAQKKTEFGSVKTETGDKKSGLDLTLSGYPFPKGSLHPLTLTINKLVEIFLKIGFSIAEGPLIEEDYYNFEALNITEFHPSRDMQDTFYVDIQDSKNKKLLLRTHTSPIQIRAMKGTKPPLRIISPGKAFRHDALDASHSFVFHQIEGFYVDKNVNMADLKWTLDTFIKELFGSAAKIRFRPSYFPFVEPGAEVDMSCIFCKDRGNHSMVRLCPTKARVDYPNACRVLSDTTHDSVVHPHWDGGAKAPEGVPSKDTKCSICKGTGWIEVLGAGIIHPNVLKNCGYDPQEWNGFAFGAGIERLAMLLFDIQDMRIFFENDLRILKQL
jgi:phenylalanyl-tRNA synthetase alpha chain